VRRSRITSLPASAYTCLRYRYRFGSVRDTMKTKSVTITSAGFQPPVPLEEKEGPLGRPRPEKPRRLIVVRSEDAATGETEGGHAEPWATCRLARAICGDLATGPHTLLWYADGSDPRQAGNSLNFSRVNPLSSVVFRRETNPQFLRDDRLSPQHV